MSSGTPGPRATPAPSPRQEMRSVHAAVAVPEACRDREELVNQALERDGIRCVLLVQKHQEWYSSERMMSQHAGCPWDRRRQPFRLAACPPSGAARRRPPAAPHRARTAN